MLPPWAGLERLLTGSLAKASALQGATVSSLDTFPQRMLATSLQRNECENGTYGERVAAVTIAAPT
jgi:hypothetical protein